MAKNPSIYNTGGIHRFIDYVSQVPDFLKAEEPLVDRDINIEKICGFMNDFR